MSIVKARYYILYFRDILNPVCLNYYFSSRQLAKDNIIRNIPRKERRWYKVVSGAYLKKYEPKIYKSLKIKLKKYRYPKPDMTDQERKNFRNLQRRRLRRMNLFIKSPGLGKLKNKNKRIKYVENKQKIADCPTTLARVITLDRRGSHRMYLIEGVKKAKRVGELFRIKARCFNFRKKEVKACTLRIKNLDILTPYLITELIQKTEKIGWKTGVL